MDAKIVKLEEIEKRYLEIGDELVKDEVASDIKLFTKYSKEQARLKGAYDAYQELKKLNNTIAEASEMLKEDDAEIKEMAQMELDEANARLPELEAHINSLLLPRDPEDEYDCLVEIRGAAGGDEGNIFAGDLYRMYQYYAQNMGYKTEVMESSESEAGGYALISFSVKGQDAYRHFKFESGAHRVQRVPDTESSGRIHTSAATVAVLPVVEDVEIDINPADIKMDVFRASGAGGQHVNKTSSAVRLTHIPTGIIAECQTERSQFQNKDYAMKLLKSRLYEIEKAKKDEALESSRRSQVGSGDRSEKIRTYNYPQGRITDHRIGMSIFQMENFLNGDIDEMVDNLIAADRAERLKGEEE